MEQTVISMSRRARRKKIGGKIMTYIGLSVVAIFLLFPYMFMLNRSFMTYDDASSIRPVYFFPHSGITFTNFIRIFSENNYLKYTLNTLKIAAFNIVAVTLSSSICAYSFSRIDWKCKGFVFAAMMATVMIPGSILTIPQYVLFANLGWTESAKPLMIPTLFGGGALNIFLLTQFMKGVSREMENAAMIDGANLLQRYFRIVLPLCKPILIYIAVGTFTGVWSDFTGPLVYLKTQEKYTLAVAIYYDSLNSSGGTAEPNIRMAVSVFISLVPAVIFFIYQKNLIEGIQVGAVKG